MNYKISVIMPIYNAEKELDKSIQSIINQSIGFNNIELILVDDASKDNSKKIIERYSEKYDNIIPYYSKTNHGFPGFGRNMGIKLASSDYIMFIDNDDEYDKNICKNLYETIISEDADVACCGKITVDGISNIKQDVSYINGAENNGKIIIKDYDILLFDSHVVWNKIFKLEIIKCNNLKFFENTRLDDRKFTFDYYLNSKKLIHLKNYHGYYWKIKSDSLSHANREQHIDDMIDCILYEYYGLKSRNIESYMDFRARNAIIGPIIECSYIQSKNELKNALKKIHDFEKEIHFNGKLNQSWAEIINKCILNEHYMTAITLLKGLNAFRKITVLRKINRKL